MRLLVTGGSSFVGAHFCRIAARDHDIFAVYHRTSLRLNGVTPLRADLRLPRDRARLLAVHADAVVHIACKIKAPGVRGQDPAAAAASANRAMMDTVLALDLPVVYASSTVVHWDKDSPYAQSRREDQARLSASGLPWAVVRPSAPYGPVLVNHQPRHRESFHTLADLVRCSPVVPVIGDGRYRRQPVHVDDLSHAILGLLTRPGGLAKQAFDAGGADALSFDQIIDLIAAEQHRQVRKLHLPKALFVKLAGLRADFEPSLIDAIDQDELADPTALTQATGWEPRSFRAGVRDLVRPG